MTDADGHLVTDLDRDKFRGLRRREARRRSRPSPTPCSRSPVVMCSIAASSIVRDFEIVDRRGLRLRRSPAAHRPGRASAASPIACRSIRAKFTSPTSPTDAGHPQDRAAAARADAAVECRQHGDDGAAPRGTGRRVVLVFTDGMDRPMNGGGHNVTLEGRGPALRIERTWWCTAIGLAGRHAVRRWPRGWRTF